MTRPDLLGNDSGFQSCGGNHDAGTRFGIGASIVVLEIDPEYPANGRQIRGPERQPFSG
jgi:hypothetical protein